jgi:hypothetical protein
MGDDGPVSAEDLENYETDMELALYREYRDVVGLFSYVVETERRFYLANQVDLQVRSAAGEVYFELTLADAWVWDVYRSARFVKSVRVVTFKDVNVEELAKAELDLGSSAGFARCGAEALRTGRREPPTAPVRRRPTHGTSTRPSVRSDALALSCPEVVRCEPRTQWDGTGKTSRQRTSSAAGGRCSTGTGGRATVSSTWWLSTVTSWWSSRSRRAGRSPSGIPRRR